MTPIHIEAFYDGNCPLCLREVRWLRLLDKRGRIRFTDIAEQNFVAGDVGVPWDDLMASIHGRLPDGRIVKGGKCSGVCTQRSASPLWWS
ncbi:MAG TPA: DUF393 domain-containing protein [Polyangia bacterium]